MKSFLANLFGQKKGETLLDVIRKCQKIRVEKSEAAKQLGITAELIDLQSDEELIGSPEATILIIGQSYDVLSKKGLTHEDILSTIEQHRNQAVSGYMPPNPSLYKYIHYRVRLEHLHGLQLNDHDILDVMLTACEYFKLPIPKSAHQELASVAKPKSAEERRKLIVAGYRRIAASRGCAPDHTVDDTRIIIIWETTQIMFGKAAVKKNEVLPEEVVNTIVLFFIQKYQILGPDNKAFYDEHFVRELQQYRKFGLREEYRQGLFLY